MDFCTVGCHTIFISFLGTSIFCCILKLSNSFMHFSPQQPSPSHFFSRAGELNIFFAVLPATSHELSLHFDIVFDTENMGLVNAQSSCWFCASNVCVRTWDVVGRYKRRGDLWDKQREDAFCRNIKVYLNYTWPPTKCDLDFDLTVKNEMSFVFYYIDFFFLKNKSDLSGRSDNGITFYGGPFLASPQLLCCCWWRRRCWLWSFKNLIVLRVTTTIHIHTHHICGWGHLYLRRFIA